MISADRVSFAYGAKLVLSCVSVEARPATVLGLIGPNGSGKTTLLRMLSAALTPHTGNVTIDGVSIASLARRELGRRIAVVAQEAAAELPFSVAEIVLLGRIAHRRSFDRTRPDDRRIAAAALRQVDARHLAGRMYAALSGGERQRVLIARALAQQADHLLLDEPTNHLDVRAQPEFMELVRTLGLTTVVVLHDLNLAARYCDELVLLDAGHVVAAGPAAAVLRPTVLEPVYGVGIRRRVEDDGIHLVFRLNSEPAPGVRAPV